MVLLVCTAFGMILREPRGAVWVLATPFTPVRDLLQRKVSGVVYLCGCAVVSYVMGGSTKPSGRQATGVPARTAPRPRRLAPKTRTEHATERPLSAEPVRHLHLA